MLKKSITYVDYNGEKQTDDCYFNLSKAELLEMEMSEKGGFENYIRTLMEEKDNKKIYKLFKDLILMSYGQKSADGRSFIKKKIMEFTVIMIKDLLLEVVMTFSLMITATRIMKVMTIPIIHMKLMVKNMLWLELNISMLKTMKFMN